MFAVAFGIFLFVSLSVAACRAVDVIRSHDAKAPRAREVTSYKGPLYSSRGRETESN